MNDKLRHFITYLETVEKGKWYKVKNEEHLKAIRELIEGKYGFGEYYLELSSDKTKYRIET